VNASAFGAAALRFDSTSCNSARSTAKMNSKSALSDLPVAPRWPGKRAPFPPTSGASGASRCSDLLQSNADGLLSTQRLALSPRTSEISSVELGAYHRHVLLVGRAIGRIAVSTGGAPLRRGGTEQPGRGHGPPAGANGSGNPVEAVGDYVTTDVVGFYFL
jgi:hypothetical protein